MPRGPGKAENYNLDYSRWSGGAWNEEGAAVVKDGADPSESQVREALRGMPPELQEAFRLQQIANQSGDPAAKQRAGELALRAVKNGSPQIQRDFIENISKHDPEVAKQLSREMQIGAGSSSSPVASAKEGLASLDGTIQSLRSRMEEGAEQTKKQLSALQAQQDQLGRLKSPEDMLKFMHEEGDMTPEDMQRIFAGDQMHMENKVREVLDKATKSAARKEKGEGNLGDFERDSEQALKEVELLHKTLTGADDSEDRGVVSVVAKGANGRPAAAEASRDVEAVQVVRPPRKEEKKEPEVTIPDYRLRYSKDEDSGRFTGVTLQCTLPGVTSMSAIALDVSEKHMRLTTSAPAPRYAVNAGPFPVLLDPGAARAKFSKKRGELTVEVPAAARAT